MVEMHRDKKMKEVMIWLRVSDNIATLVEVCAAQKTSLLKKAPAKLIGTRECLVRLTNTHILEDIMMES